MNLGELESTLYDRLGFASSPDSAITRRIRRMINDSHREILGKRAFSRLLRTPITCSSVANDPLMVLPQAATKIIIISDRVNNRNLTPISLQDVRYRDPGLNFTGSIPDAYAVVNFAASVALQPTGLVDTFAISDSASDGSGISVSVEGVITGGYYRHVSIAMNGVTAVQLNTSPWFFTHISKFYLSASAAGNVTLRSTSGAGTELARIVKSRSFPRYTQVHLSATPSTAIVYTCDVELHIEDMHAANDEPLLPENFHWLLECGAMRKEFLKREKLALWKIEDANWRQGISDLRGWLSSQGGVSAAGQRGSGGRQLSQLGSNYPAGS